VIAMKMTSMALGAAIALSALFSAPARSEPPSFGYYIWRGGPTGFSLPGTPPNSAIPLVDYLGMNPGYAPLPRVGCYFTRARMHNAWTRVEVCY
jgi:hypothetical protein